MSTSPFITVIFLLLWYLVAPSGYLSKDFDRRDIFFTQISFPVALLINFLFVMLFFKVRVLTLSAMNVKKYSDFLFFSSHQVIVLNVVNGVEDLPIDFASKIKDSNNSEIGNLNFYVAAEIKNTPGNEVSWEFSVGDGKTYGAYRNKELQIGEDYIVYQRAMTYDNDVSNF